MYWRPQILENFNQLSYKALNIYRISHHWLLLFFFSLVISLECITFDLNVIKWNYQDFSWIDIDCLKKLKLVIE